MNEGSWDLNGVDPATRDRALEEAARHGMSVADYLTHAILVSALAEQDAAGDGPDLEPAAGEVAVRRSLKALKRRLGSAADSLEGAIEALDSALEDMSERMGAVEALSGGAGRALQDMGADLNAVRTQLAKVQDAVAADVDANESAHADLAAACVGLGRRVDGAETAARAAAADAAALARAQEALKRAVAQDMSAFAQETAQRLGSGLDDVRAAADAAAAQAEAAAAHVVGELRGVREMLEGRLAESAAETRARVQAAFGETANRIAALTDRVADNERAHTRAAEQLRAQMADVEDSAQTALEETAESLRKADAALAGSLTRVQQDARDALAATRAALSHDITELRQAQAASAAQLKKAEASAAAAASDAAALRNALERRTAAAAAEARAEIARTEQVWENRFGALAARVDRDAQEGEEARHALRAEAERIEASTLAALEKLAGDIAAGDVSGAVSSLESGVAHMSARVTRLERVEARAEAEQAAIIALAKRIGDLEQQQATGLDSLRAEIANFVGRNDGRLAALEAGAAGFDAQEMIGEFADLRLRIEERIAAVERRSVRMLEQVAETVVSLDKRLNGAPEPAARSA